ncbi:MAG: GTP cyclohydrolase II [Actinobacteria bacterium]|nr:GTP cyclohydrolase II [Actinomycetota bacterium]
MSAPPGGGLPLSPPVEVARVTIPTPFGEFCARAFELAGGPVYLALVKGDVATEAPVLARLHSECLTGDSFGSLRCDCGVQLSTALRLIAAEGRGVLLYVTGQEGRGIGLVNKLRAYMEQDDGHDTLDANLRLGLPVDARDYSTAARVLASLGVGEVRLLTNNPAKAEGLAAAGVGVESLVPLPTAAHGRNLAYLRTKQLRLGHVQPLGAELELLLPQPAPDANSLLGRAQPRPDRPHVVVKYAQTLDGRIATATGDARWISGEPERALSHGLRAACDAVLVGVGTVLVDDPQLTVRMVSGASPLRVVLDTTLSTPPDARVLSEDAGTVILTTDRSPAPRRRALRSHGVTVRVVPSGPQGVSLAAGLAVLKDMGVRTLLVEGGSRVITSLLGAAAVDRLLVAIAPIVMGAGTDAVGPLGVSRVADGLRLANRSAHVVGSDLLLAWDVAGFGAPAAGDARAAGDVPAGPA